MTTLAKFVDRANRVDSPVQRPASVEVLLDSREQVLAGRFSALGTIGVVRRIDPGMLEGLVGGHPCFRIGYQAPFDEVTSRVGYAAPVFSRGERIVSCKDGLHLFQVGVPVKRRVSA